MISRDARDRINDARQELESTRDTIEEEADEGDKDALISVCGLEVAIYILGQLT